MIHPASQALRITIIGAGIFGREHLSRLAVRDDVIIADAVDSSEAVAAFIKQNYSAAVLFRSAAALRGGVAGRHHCGHFRYHALCHYLPARSLDIPVLLEKPVLERAAEAGKLNALTHGRQAYILPAHVLQFSAGHAQLCSLVKSVAVGDVIYISSRRYRDDVHMERYPDTDPVLMMLIHDIDLALWLSPMPFVTARGSRSEGPGFRSLTTADLETASGKDLRREVRDMKVLVVDLTLENRLLKKSMIADGGDEE